MCPTSCLAMIATTVFAVLADIVFVAAARTDESKRATTVAMTTSSCVEATSCFKLSDQPHDTSY